MVYVLPAWPRNENWPWGEVLFFSASVPSASFKINIILTHEPAIGLEGLATIVQYPLIAPGVFEVPPLLNFMPIPCPRLVSVGVAFTPSASVALSVSAKLKAVGSVRKSDKIKSGWKKFNMD